VKNAAKLESNTTTIDSWSDKKELVPFQIQTTKQREEEAMTETHASEPKLNPRRTQSNKNTKTAGSDRSKVIPPVSSNVVLRYHYFLFLDSICV
jgi:hypothetical protein